MKREASVFELLKEVNMEDVLETIEGFFKDKVKKDGISEIKERALQLGKDYDLYLESVGKNTKEKSSSQLDVECLYEMIIEKYRAFKSELQQQLIKHKVVNEGVKYEDDYYTYEGFIRIIEKLHWIDQEHPESYFNKWSAFVGTSDETGPSKKINLETLLSHMFRSQVAIKKIF